MRLSAEMRTFADECDWMPVCKQRLVEWANRVEKMEQALVEIGSKAVDGVDHDFPLKMAETLRKIEGLATDALTGSSKKEEVDPTDAVCVCCGTRFGVKEGGETRRCEKCAEILHTLI